MNLDHFQLQALQFLCIEGVIDYSQRSALNAINWRRKPFDAK